MAIQNKCHIRHRLFIKDGLSESNIHTTKYEDSESQYPKYNATYPHRCLRYLQPKYQHVVIQLSVVKGPALPSNIGEFYLWKLVDEQSIVSLQLPYLGMVSIMVVMNFVAIAQNCATLGVGGGGGGGGEVSYHRPLRSPIPLPHYVAVIFSLPM